MTRRPNLARACHQLERHGSGTPNDPPPVQPTWMQNLAAVRDAMPTLAEQYENIRLWQEAWRKAAS